MRNHQLLNRLLLLVRDRKLNDFIERRLDVGASALPDTERPHADQLDQAGAVERPSLGQGAYIVVDGRRNMEA